MDLIWYRRYLAAGGDANFLSWEFSAGASGFGDDAPAPARVGQRLAELVGVELENSDAPAANNVVHWLTGIGWGKVAGIATSVLPWPRIPIGVGTGVAAWATSYAVLGRLGIYKPISEYDRATLRQDLTAHLAFGMAVGAALSIADRHPHP
jgi:hypothetical protein